MKRISEGRSIFEHHNKILQMVSENTPLLKVLATLLEFTEKCFPDSYGSILLYNEETHTLDTGIAPNLPPQFLEKMTSLKIGPLACGCGTAAYLGETVIASDISTNPLWSNYNIKKLFGLQASWSKPLISPRGLTLGTIALYFKDNRSPQGQDLEVLDYFAKLAAVVIDYKQSDEKISRLVHYDLITGLPNGTQFNKILSEHICTNKKSYSPFSILFIDIDRFSVINNLVGYERGDQILKLVASRILECLPQNSTLSRWNSDKFMCLIPQEYFEQTTHFVQEILDNLSSPIHIDEHEFVVTSSIGLSLFPNDGELSNLLIKNAEIAMKEAKKEGKNTYKFYQSCMNDRLTDQLFIEKGLRDALRFNQFFLCYQPQVDVYSNKIVGLEALIRWNHPKIGIVSPAQFIPVAEETGLIIPIGEWVLRTACEQMLQWHQEGFEDLRLSVNISGIQLHQSDLVSFIEKTIIDLNYPASSLVLEVTESTLMKNLDNTKNQLIHLKNLGITISLDDFGTLYSSLNYLKSLPLDILKVDRAYIRDMQADKKDLEIVKTIIKLGHSLKMKVLAEGVENQLQLQLLQKQKCDEVQGFYFSKPLTVEELDLHFKENLYISKPSIL